MAPVNELLTAQMSPPAGAATIFSLGNEHAYRRWRDAKLAAYPRAPNALTVEVEDLAAPTRAETRAVLAACRRANLCLYRARAHRGDARATRRALGAFARHFGLTRFEAQRSAAADGIVALEIAAQGGRHGYIPYTNRPIGWHTDGYYNYAGPRQMIRAMLLHCVRSASLGGDNGLIDHEIAYIRLRDENPDYVAALMHPQAMSVPASEAADGKPRAENTGPVFVVDPDTGALGMRYTARKRNIGWHADAVAAAAALERLLADEALALRVKLAPGDGVICNNVLHDRIGFEADSDRGGGRLIYRVRSYDRVGDACGAPRADEGA